MNIQDVKALVASAITFCEASQDPCLKEMLHDRIDVFLSKFTDIMGRPLDSFKSDKKVSDDVEELAAQLRECFTV